ncbi:EndoU domain-containing protein [Vibrio cholerae]|nr:EndoU domain-containing protein [Vibrio cholerae]MCD6645956.1 EndoU domain-containing protein [Vibrio cholerae]
MKMKMKMKIYGTHLIFLSIFLPFTVNATGIECDKLSTWSNTYDGMVVNQHHIFCGEPNKNNTKAVGFHSMPDNNPPSTFKSSETSSPENEFGLYSLKKIVLDFNGLKVEKAFSTMFPTSCTLEQINASAVYSYKNSNGQCKNVNWATCGPSSPKEDNSKLYCIGKNGKAFTIATATLPNDNTKLNTAFPIDE